MAETATSLNPFTPTNCHVLPARVEHVLSRLLGPRVKGADYLKPGPLPPARIIGPDGVGKTAMIAWTEHLAQEHDINVVSCTGPKDGGKNANPFLHLLDILENGGMLRELTKEFDMKLPLAGGNIAINKGRPHVTYRWVIKEIVAKTSLLLLLDDVHNYSFGKLSLLLDINRRICAQGYPLGMVFAVTPGIDRLLRKDEPLFTDSNERLYLNALSDEEARETFQAPFEQAGVTVTPEALEAMMAQTEGYPHFIQLLGNAAWQEMEKAGRKEIDADIVARAAAQANKQRHEVYSNIYNRLDSNDLLPYARQVMELIDSSGGKAHEDRITELLLDSNPRMRKKRAYEISEHLHDDGFLWTYIDETSASIPSIFSYFKARQQREHRST